MAPLEAHGVEWRQALPASAAAAPIAPSRLSTAEKVVLFGRLFRGRQDVFPIRWESKTSGKSGYAPACANEWRPGVCEKPRIKCSDCGVRELVPLQQLTMCSRGQEHAVNTMQGLQKAFERNSAEHYLREPQISSYDHYCRLVRELGRSILLVRKIYLDTRYWLFLRDAAMNRPRRREHSELLELLRQAATQRVGLCPFSDAIFLEVTKQTDPVTWIATIDLVDELSQGVALLTERHRIETELVHVLADFGAKLAVSALDELVWVRVGYALGGLSPFHPDIDAGQMRAIQKAFMDQLWVSTLRDLLVDQDRSATEGETESMEQAVSNINERAKQHSDEIRSFQQAFATEVYGVLSAFRDHMFDAMVHLHRVKTRQIAVYSTEEREKTVDSVHGMLANAFKYAPDRMMARCPSLFALAMCHAAVRWNRSMKLDAHDLLDFHHAAAGVAHCDAMFTEKPLKDMLAANHMALDQKLACTVISDEHQAIAYVRSLLEGRPT